MTTYRLFDGVSGRPGVGSSGTQPPTSPAGYTGPFLAGTVFSALGQVVWLQGYYWWCPPGGDTGSQEFCTWNRYANSTQILVPGTTATSGTLTAGAMNFIPLTTPVPLAPGELYVAATGWASVNGFPVSNNQFGTGEPYVGGITSGPLTAWADPSNGGTHIYPTGYAPPQGCFSVAGSDPTVNMPNAGSNSANFWVDVQVSDTAPPGYAGSYRLYPNMAEAAASGNDTANNFTLGMEFSLTQACTISNVWFYSAPSLTQLPTSTGVFRVSDMSLVATQASPSWSGAAGSGWVSSPLAGTLAAGTSYKVCVCNGAGSPAIWNVATAAYFSTGFGGSGLTAGPITVPNNATADAPGQETYNPGATLTYPATNAGPFTYWLDIEVAPVAASPAAAPVLYSMRMMP